MTVMCSAVMTVLSAMAGYAGKETPKPNVMFIIADDQTYESISAYGLTEVKTPNLDRLVERGVSFTHTYNMGAWGGAVCVASRAMLNTGAFVNRAQKMTTQVPQWAQVVADNTVEFFEQAKDDDKPFFMYLAFNAPHDPRQAPKEYVDMYPLDSIKVPANFLPEYPYADAICGKKLRDELLMPYPRTEYAVKRNRQEYYAAATYMDHHIGRMLDALEASGKADNTTIIFTADHGLSVGHHGLAGKQSR